MQRFIPIAVLLFAIILTSIADSAENSASNLNRLRALGTAYMEEEDFPNAVRVFEEAVALVPESVSDVINLGIANYHGDHNDESIRFLKQAREKEPNNPFANYTLGLAYKKIGDTTNALTYFKKTADVDESDPPTLYNLGLAYFNLKKSDEAATWFEKTIALDPKHSASYYNLFLHYARVKKDMAHAKKLMATFQELKKNEPDRPADAVDEGKFLGPIEFEIPRGDLPNFTSGLEVKFERNAALTEAIAKAFKPSDKTDDPKQPRFLAAIPDLEKRQTAVVASNPTQTMLLVIDSSGSILQTVDLGPNWVGCAYADYDNDGDVDLFLHDFARIALMRNEGDWKLTDAAETLDLGETGCAAALWCDFDAEGDLDLLLGRPDNGDVILQNNGNGTFTDVSGAIEGFPMGKSYAIAVSDLDNDNDLDIVRAFMSETETQAFMDRKLCVEAFVNLREVRFKKAAEKTIPFQYSNWYYQPFEMRCRDLNNDGDMEIVLFGLTFGKEPVYALHLDPTQGFTDVSGFGQIGIPPVLMSAADVNNDGYEDLLASWNPPVGAVKFEIEGKIPQVLINQSPKDYIIDRLAIPFDEPKKAYYFSPRTADLDFDGDLDVLASTPDSFTVLTNTNGNQNRSITLKVKGSKNTSHGYGAKILIKDDLFFAKKEIDSTVTHIGLGEREQADVIRITWPNGIFQNLIHTPAGTVKSVTEKPGYAGSCLFVYTWNGKEFEFIADSLCNAPLGLYLGGGQYYPPNPDEYIRILGNQLVPQNGEYEIRMREELREITYLDEMELLSASHPQAVEIHSNECFTVPPFPEFKLLGLSKNARPPKKVAVDGGSDVTDLISKNDYRYPTPWEGQSRMDGVVKEHAFVIDLGDVQDARHLTLFMTGYLDWPNSSNARSLDQNPEHDFVMPMLQVKNEKDEWQTIYNPMGFPAGKLKTVPVDISNVFLTNDRSIRIVSTVQVHWDRILVDPTPYLDGFTVRHYPLKSADLRFGGYARTYQLSEHGPQWYDYNTRYTNSRWDYQIGNFTRFGDVYPLLTEFDNKYVIIQHGDEVCVRFDATQDKLQGNQNRTFFMKAMGWVKDLDESTAYGQTVEPLPFKGMSGYPYGPDESYPWDEERVAYHLEYNTRVITKQNPPLTAPRAIASPQAAAPSPRESE